MSQVSKDKKKAWIAISGNIASGKSSVLAYIKKKGFPIVDCDQINADLQQVGQAGYQQILATFGHAYLDENQQINRKALASLIFSNNQAKKKLEELMHPLILSQLEKIKQESIKTTFVEVPLLFELGWQKYFDESWLVVSDSQMLIERCMLNRNMNEKQIKERLNAQMSAELKKETADVIIYNQTNLEDLYQQIDEILERRHYG